MDKQTKILLTVMLGVVGIGASTLYFGPNEMPFWAEFSKWAPAVVITILAFIAAENSRDEARGSREEARGSREAGERAEQEARASRDSAERAEVEARVGSERAERAEMEARTGRERAERAEIAAIGTRRQKRQLRRDAR